ncbi:hypothetical protein NPIL_513351 [Nephila pilipes]|uniref:Uncharacterized protein n=1 Tax=Nephila pilipes TaxID=299642 RepID=A0A8X6QUS7_NEPPI|nr:hypothetical protein NPIL_513351 [Nephila pilipes]
MTSGRREQCINQNQVLLNNPHRISNIPVKNAVLATVERRVKVCRSAPNRSFGERKSASCTWSSYERRSATLLEFKEVSPARGVLPG